MFLVLSCLFMNIRCETTQDNLAIAQINTLAFAREKEAQIVEKIHNSDRYIPELSLIAEVNGTVVGHVLFSYIPHSALQLEVQRDYSKIKAKSQDN
ncbi:MAG: N-acetyltransferase [Calothrix sp. SM1_7_51]|nr:N-acetyltransferase [Calothrix sp. SM1_7_51]